MVSLSRDFGGVESLFLNICKHCDREKIQYDFLCTDTSAAREEEFLATGAKVYHLPGIRHHLREYAAKLRQLIREGKYDVLHVNMTRYMFPLDILIAKRCGLKVVLHCHSTQIYYTGKKKTDILRKIEQVIFRPVALSHADALIACSRNAGEYLFRKKPYQVILNGIDIRRCRYSAEDRARLREELGIGENETVIGHIGRFSHEKNHEFLLALFRECLKTNPDLRLLAIGSGDHFERIRQLAETMQIADRVVFTGVRSDVAQLLSAMDLFVFPSIHEALPVTLIEAQANGLKCIVSDCVTKEVDESGGLEYHSLQEGAEKWASAVSRILNAGEGRTEPLSPEHSAFDIQKMIAALYQVYQR